MSRAFEQPLFHGTIASIDHIDVSCGRAHKDFGRKGVYGPIGSDVAKEVLLSALEPENLGVQCCLCSTKSESAVMTFVPVNWRMYV